MNREWSDKNKLAQSKLKKATFYDGINEFLKLREIALKIGILSLQARRQLQVCYSFWR